MNGAQHRAQYKTHHPQILAGLLLKTGTIFIFPVTWLDGGFQNSP